jgi:hypothetical protein
MKLIDNTHGRIFGVGRMIVKRSIRRRMGNVGIVPMKMKGLNCR